MSRTGLGQFGVTPPTVVREPAKDSQSVQICAECGHPVSKTKGPKRIEKPDLVHVALAVAFDQLIAFGWSCDRHPYEVVMPVHAGGAEAGAMTDGWTGVDLRFTDEHVRYVPVPEREVSEHVE